MNELEFKKLLLDLRMSIAEIGRMVGLSRTGVRKYLRGELKDPERRRQIKYVLSARAKGTGVRLPAFWPDAK